MSVGGSDNRDTYPNLLPNCHKIEPPLDNKALGKVETLLKKQPIDVARIREIVLRYQPGSITDIFPILVLPRRKTFGNNVVPPAISTVSSTYAVRGSMTIAVPDFA